MPDFQGSNFGGAPEDVNGPFDSSPGPLDLRMAGAADDDQIKLLVTKLPGLTMHIGNQWTGRVYDAQVSPFTLRDYRSRYLMSTEDRYCSQRHFLKGFKKNCPLFS